MNLFIYSDESGVFDNNHNDYFVFGGIICFGKEEKDSITRKYSHVEKTIRINGGYSFEDELKASFITNKEKGKIYRSLNNVYKFCVLIKQKKVLKQVYENKKHKQRYLDFAYKMVLKKCLDYLIINKVLNPDDVENIYVYADEHSTATDGRYELRENLLNEFKYGTFNSNYGIYHEPIFPNIKNVDLKFCNSASNYLVRASDIVANHFYHVAISNKKLLSERNSFYMNYLHEMLYLMV